MKSRQTNTEGDKTAEKNIYIIHYTLYTLYIYIINEKMLA